MAAPFLYGAKAGPYGVRLHVAIQRVKPGLRIAAHHNDKYIVWVLRGYLFKAERFKQAVVARGYVVKPKGFKHNAGMRILIALRLCARAEGAYEKHAPAAEVPRIRMVWNSIRGQLARENKKFIFGTLKQGARAREFELAIEWLRDAGLVHKVNRTKKGLLPLSAYEDFSAFKLFMLDIGLMVAMSKLSPQVLIEGNSLFLDAKGAFAEQYVLQQFKTCGREMDVYYWSADNSSGEIDFLVQANDKIIPVEVKAEENLRAKSLRSFVSANPGLHGVRLSMSAYREQDWMTNYPLYAASCVVDN